MKRPWLTVPWGVVYSVKSRGPSTEPWGDTNGKLSFRRKSPSSSLICWLLPVKYEGNWCSTWPDIPNQFCNLPKSMEWSMVSKAGDKSNKVRAVTMRPCSLQSKYHYIYLYCTTVTLAHANHLLCLWSWMVWKTNNSILIEHMVAEECCFSWMILSVSWLKGIWFIWIS